MKLLLKGNKALTLDNKPLTVPGLQETIHVTVRENQNKVLVNIPTPNVIVREVI